MIALWLFCRHLTGTTTIKYMKGQVIAEIIKRKSENNE